MVRYRFIAALLVTFLVAAGARAAYAGVTQQGNWDGRSESYSAVVIGGGSGEGASGKEQKIPDGSRRNPDVVPPSFPTAYECGKGFSGGVSAFGFGGSGGGVAESEECNARADAAYAAKLGDHITAREIMCAKERYYMGNKRAQQVYAHMNRKYVDEQGMPLACLPNSDFDKTHKDQENAKKHRANDAHAGAIPSSWSDY